MSIFASNKIKRLKTSRFDLSHTNLLTTKFGQLVPFMYMDCVPGDKVRLKSEMLVKFAPMIAPIMSEIDIMTWYFKVPYRLVWDNWEDFITGGRLGTTEPPFPTFTITRDQQRNYASLLGTKSLCDYFGVPNFQGDVNSENGFQTMTFSQLPFRAYQLIYNDYFRDQNLETEIPIPKSNGDMTISSNMNTVMSILSLRSKKFKKDYFTSALPWAQRYGNDEVTVPLTGRLDVMLDDDQTKQGFVMNDGSGNHIYNTDVKTDGNGELNGLIDPNGSLYTDFQQSDGVGLNIQDLRYSNALQRWLENNARFGSRYIEQILARFGIRSSDARLQRPELIGGGIQNVMISEIMQQSQSTDTSPQGNRSGDANSFGVHRSYKDVFCEEHCMIIGIMSIVPKSLYYQGIPKHLTKFDKFEFFNPEFQTLGEQPIQNKEIYYSGDPDADNATFGYTPRYSEYKFKLGEIHGDFKDSLDFFHMARQFANRPALNNNFISVGDADYERIWAVTKDGDGNDVQFSRCWVQIYNHISAKRPMMYNPNPTL